MKNCFPNRESTLQACKVVSRIGKAFCKGAKPFPEPGRHFAGLKSRFPNREGTSQGCKAVSQAGMAFYEGAEPFPEPGLQSRLKNNTCGYK